ncbi:hypothetical protein WAE61_18370 [Comamonadaceae bacterium PP-2]
MGKVVQIGLTFAGAVIGGPWGAALMAAAVATGIYTQRRQLKKQQRGARDAYNSGLADRNVSVIAADPPATYIYGRATVGPVVVDVITSGDRDQFKHVVMVWAAHECDGIEDFFIAAESVGEIGADGWVTGGKWAQASTVTEKYAAGTFDASGRLSVEHSIAKFVQAMRQEGGGDTVETYILHANQVDVSGNAIQLKPEAMEEWAGKTVSVYYNWTNSNTRVRVRHFLGSADQEADQVLIDLTGGYWKSSDRLRGLCYSVVTFDLNETELQSGLPQCTVKIRGKKLFDPRSNTTAWTDNPALCVNDFLISPYGKSCLQSQVEGVIEAANACDEVVTVGEHTGRRYTCNGAWTSTDEPDTVMENIARSMAGYVSPGGVWRVLAGVYTPPVMLLGDRHAAGALQMIPAPGRSDAWNGMKGQFYDPNQYNQPVDFEPYQVADYVQRDGGETWGNLALPFTDEAWRARTIAAIEVERSRMGQLIWKGTLATLRANVGNRVAVNNKLLGLDSAIYRLAKRDFDISREYIQLTLTRDDPAIYDIVNQVAAPAPNTPGENAYQVQPPANVVVTSPSAGQILITLDASTDVRVQSGGGLIVQYRLADAADWTTGPQGQGTATAYVLSGLAAGFYIVRVDWRSALGAQSNQWEVETVQVLAPAFATGQQGSLAESALQPGDVSDAGKSGDYNDLFNKPVLGTAASKNVEFFATAAQGAKADGALPATSLAGALAPLAPKTSPDFAGVVGLPAYLLADLVDGMAADLHEHKSILVTDAAGAPAHCISDGEDWISQISGLPVE